MKTKRSDVSALFLLLGIGFLTSFSLKGADAYNYEVTTFSKPSNLPDGIGNGGLCGPIGITLDGAGNVYVADQFNKAIRKISSGGVVTTLAGNGSSGFSDGSGTNATFYYPMGVAVDRVGNVYVADQENNAIRKISSGGVVTTLAGNGKQGFVDGVGNNATFNWPSGVAVDGAGNVYVADSYNSAIRKISTGGVVTTLVGGGINAYGYAYGFADGIGKAAFFSWPSSVAVDGVGNLYVADSGNNAIRRVSTNGLVTTLAGNGNWGFADGTGTNAYFNRPGGVAIDGVGNLYVADSGNNAIRKISSNGVVTTLAGNGKYGFTNNGIGTKATFNDPNGIAVDGMGNVYVADSGNNAIRKLTPHYFNVITFGSIAPKTFGSAPFLLVASASSLLPVSFTSSSPGIATISGSNNVIIVGAGTSTITARQAGNANYNAATPVNQIFVVNKAANSITFVQPSARTYTNGATFALTATAPGGQVAFASSNTSVITIAGTIATIKGAGTAVITANQQGNSNYLTAAPVAKTVTVNKADQTLTFNPTSLINAATTKSFALSGSSTSGLSLTYTSSATNIISISGSTATVKSKGVATLTASQAGNANYNAATAVAKSVIVK
jgi:sugar lactone lactonase YvrE